MNACEVASSWTESRVSHGPSDGASSQESARQVSGTISDIGYAQKSPRTAHRTLVAAKQKLVFLTEMFNSRHWTGSQPPLQAFSVADLCR